MTLVKRNIPNNFPSVFDELLNTDWLGGRTSNFTNTTPSVNIIERDDAFAIELAAPGMKKDDFQIELDNETLTISSKEKNEEATTESGKYTRREFSYASFRRTFNLPESVNTAEITANYEHGILTLGLPKREEAQLQPARMIEIA